MRRLAKRLGGLAVLGLVASCIEPKDFPEAVDSAGGAGGRSAATNGGSPARVVDAGGRVGAPADADFSEAGSDFSEAGTSGGASNDELDGLDHPQDAGGISDESTISMSHAGLEPELASLGERCRVDQDCESTLCVDSWESDRKTCCEVACSDEQRCGAAGTCEECEPFTQEECYESDDGTPLPIDAQSSTGNCRVGNRVCSPDGFWGACVGSVSPKAQDSCSVAGSDDNCDGLRNGGCPCVDEEERPCGTDIGNCAAGMQRCSNGAWSECVGEVSAQPQDSCATQGDDANCNGTPNEDCECIGDNTTQACGECGTQTCNPDARLWGSCTRPAGTAATRCKSGSSTLLETCDTQGQWATSSCSLVCQDGACGGECAPGASRCLTGPERRQTCVDGFWDTVETCSTGSECVNEGASCRRSNGGSCAADTDCVSGFCVDGICCVSDCTAVTCSSFNTQCLSHPTLVTTNLCGGNGQCRSATDVCSSVASPVTNGAACDFSGLDGGRCDGAGNCEAPTVVCAAQTCSLDATICCQQDRLEKNGPAYLACTAEANCAWSASPYDRAIFCDEDEDCAGGEQCCWINTPGGVRTDCATTCPYTNPGGNGGGKSLCRSPVMQRACPTGTTCTPTDVSGYSVCDD